MVQARSEPRSVGQLSGSMASDTIQHSKMKAYCLVSYQCSSWLTAVQGPCFPDHDLCPLSGLPAMNYKHPIPRPKGGRREPKSNATKLFPYFQSFNPLQRRPHKHPEFSNIPHREGLQNMSWALTFFAKHHLKVRSLQPLEFIQLPNYKNPTPTEGYYLG